MWDRVGTIVLWRQLESNYKVCKAIWTLELVLFVIEIARFASTNNFDSKLVFSKYYYSVVKKYTFLILAVISSFPRIFSALLADSLSRSYFSRFRVSAQRLEDSISSTCARSWDSRADIDIKRSLRTPLRLSWVPVKGPSTWVNLRSFVYLRLGLNQRSS